MGVKKTTRTPNRKAPDKQKAVVMEQNIFLREALHEAHYIMRTKIKWCEKDCMLCKWDADYYHLLKTPPGHEHLDDDG